MLPGRVQSRLDRNLFEVPTLGRDGLARIGAICVSEPLVPRTTRVARVLERSLGPQPQLRLSNIAAAASRHLRHGRPRTIERRQIVLVRVHSLAGDCVPFVWISALTIELLEYDFFQSITNQRWSTVRCRIANAFILRNEWHRVYTNQRVVVDVRSEERRVGKECRCWWWTEH